ncbi:hypothetical protein [Sphingosinithalassobacter sp. LHW66-3]|uniref:hypothetical protein n=1 Tax=Sphingosinithalassobacter sp. LHW66-3 TaxID=3424718 RepID=UPI003D6A62F7
MRLAKFLTAVAAASMATAPAIAAPASVLSLAQSDVRASTDGENESDVAPAIIVGVLAVAAVIGGVVAVVDGDDEPDSP